MLSEPTDTFSGVLSALLPGIREFRNPLVTGVLWASSIWLLFGEAIITHEASQRFAERFDELDLPPSIWLSVAAFAAYLLGSLLVVRSSPFSWFLSRRFVQTFRLKIDTLNEGKRARRRSLRPVMWFWRRHVIGGRFSRLQSLGAGSGETYRPVNGWLHNEFQSLWADGWVPVTRSFDGGCTAPTGFEAFYDPKTINNHPAFGDRRDELRLYLADCFVREVQGEREAVEVRIQMRFPEVYAEIDRLKVEAEFRLSIFWPLVLMVLVLGVQWSAWVVLLLVMPPWLARDGFQRRRQADDKTWGALMAREVTSPIFDAMATAKQQECRNFAARYQRGPHEPGSIASHA